MSSVPRPKIMWARVESGIRKRINDSGKTVYEVRVRRKGQPERTLTCPTLREARRQRDTMRARAWEGRHIQGAEGRRKTVAELCEPFLKARYAGRTDHSHRPTHEGHLRWWCERIGNRSLATISPESLVPFREELIGRVTPTTCHRYFASLSGAFAWAMQDERQWVASNSVRLVVRPRDERPLEMRERIRFLDADEPERLLAACKQSRCPWLYQVVVMALSTGARKGELLNLRWRDIDLQKGTVIFRATKNGTNRTIALVDPVIGVLRDRARARHTPTYGLSFSCPVRNEASQYP